MILFLNVVLRLVVRRINGIVSVNGWVRYGRIVVLKSAVMELIVIAMGLIVLSVAMGLIVMIVIAVVSIVADAIAMDVIAADLQYLSQYY